MTDLARYQDPLTIQPVLNTAKTIAARTVRRSSSVRACVTKVSKASAAMDHASSSRRCWA